jgi:hypothetical protein
VLATLEWTRDPRLRQIYDSWSETHDRRERAMLENINRYCGSRALSHGVFLVGAAHTRAVLQKVREQRGVGAPGVLWELVSLG